MRHEIVVGGILFAPFALYCLIALPLFLLLRFILARLGVMRRVWHPALFETALYVSILSLLVILT